MKINKVDILAVGVHPDDVELGCAGTLIKSRSQGLSFGICDLTQGELGTRGSAELRLKEAEDAAKISGASFRVNLGMKDGFFELNEENEKQIIEIIREAQPQILICNAPSDRHPDHGRSSELTKVAAFLSGLRRIETSHDGKNQEAWRPKVVLHYIQDNFIEPNLIIDVGAFWELKMKAVKAFKSQFYDPESDEPMSSISSKEFMQIVDSRGLQMGRYIGASYGEGFITSRPVGVERLDQII